MCWLLLWNEGLLDDGKPDRTHSFGSPSFKGETDARITSIVGTGDSKPPKVLNTEPSTEKTPGRDTNKASPCPGIFVEGELSKDQAGRHLHLREAQPRGWRANLAVLQP